MLCESIPIEVNYASVNAQHSAYQPVLKTYILEGSHEINFMFRRPAVIICPGGSYRFTSERESEAVALQYASAGFHAFILKYSCAPARFPASLLELAKAVSLVRKNADNWNIQKNKIIISGFSAGGHLSASLGVFWNRQFIQTALDVSPKDYKPNGLILAYPVITSGIHGHEESFKNLLGDADKKMEFVSLEKHVSNATPPVFLWHTQEDTSVPVENSLLFAAALRKNNVPFELHIYQKGDHGLSLANEQTAIFPGQNEPHVQGWIDLALDWVKNL